MDKSNPLHDGIPSVCDVLLDRIQQHVAFKPDQMTVNEYKPGQGTVETAQCLAIIFDSSGLQMIFFSHLTGQRSFHNFRTSYKIG